MHERVVNTGMANARIPAISQLPLIPAAKGEQHPVIRDGAREALASLAGPAPAGEVHESTRQGYRGSLLRRRHCQGCGKVINPSKLKEGAQWQMDLWYAAVSRPEEAQAARSA